MKDAFGCKDQIEISKGQKATFFRLERLEKQGVGQVGSLPFSVKVLLEQALRNQDGFQVKKEDIETLAKWQPDNPGEREIAFKPSRVVLQDFTGVPSLVDLAALRNAMLDQKGNPSLINPQVPVDLIIDHSIQVDSFGSALALEENMKKEFERNRERYEFLKWGQGAFKNFKIYPPGLGIVHQINLERLAQVVHLRDGVCFPDTVVGTDSHTTMVNGLGVLGWGVGGIEAESVMLDQPVFMKAPQVVGFKLTGSLKPGTTATDLVLKVVEILRSMGVVDKFIEFYGSGLSSLSLADRATIANMAPEYGATMGFFPVDEGTLDYLRRTGRPAELIDRVEIYCKEQGLFRTDATPDPRFSQSVGLDLSEVEPSLAGPKRPQDRIDLSKMKDQWKNILKAPLEERGFGLKQKELDKIHDAEADGEHKLEHGAIVIAAITSCTNTSNPSVMISAGLLAKKAVEKGLQVKPWVKTSLAPGSRVVSDYLKLAGLDVYLEKLGFYTVGYGCTTCIGNSGPLLKEVSKEIKDKNLVAASVLSGNRNFEGRVNPEVKANFLASPPLVVAYAIAGSIGLDLNEGSLGKDKDGKDVQLKDIWPTTEEIAEVEELINPDMYLKRYDNLDEVSPLWNEIPEKKGEVYDWDPKSTYIRRPPFFDQMPEEPEPLRDIRHARSLLILGDSVTTDHISPAGSFTPDTQAGKYLIRKGVNVQDFNSYGSRRGNDEVMVRGTFANIRLRNQMTHWIEGGYSLHLPSGLQLRVFEAAERYQREGVPLLVIAGKEYGTGSSRDWAAKGTYLLGVKAVIATSYERIHRSNLVGMGVLPLQFKDGKSAKDYQLNGRETFSIMGLNDDLKPGQDLILKTVINETTLKHMEQEIEVTCRLDTPVELEYYRNGGILHTVLRNFIRQSKA